MCHPIKGMYIIYKSLNYITKTLQNQEKCYHSIKLYKKLHRPHRVIDCGKVVVVVWGGIILSSLTVMVGGPFQHVICNDKNYAHCCFILFIQSIKLKY